MYDINSTSVPISISNLFSKVSTQHVVVHVRQHLSILTQNNLPKTLLKNLWKTIQNSRIWRLLCWSWCANDNSRSHWNIRGIGGNICVTKRGHCTLYSKERHIGGLANRLDGTFTAVAVTTWHDAVCKTGAERQATHDFYLLPKCCLFQWIFSLAGRLWLSKWALFLPPVSYWEVVTRRILIFCSSFLVGMICPLMRVESIYFDLFWNVNFFIAAK